MLINDWQSIKIEQVKFDGSRESRTKNAITSALYDDDQNDEVKLSWKSGMAVRLSSEATMPEPLLCGVVTSYVLEKISDRYRIDIIYIYDSTDRCYISINIYTDRYPIGWLKGYPICIL